jgi:hypothetical protein
MRIFMAWLLALTISIAPCAAQTWERIKPDGLGFEVEFPVKPELKESTGDDGGAIRTYAVMFEGAAYDFTIWDFKEGAVLPSEIDRVLDNMRDNSVKSISGTPRTETKIEIGGHKARDLTADVMGMVWRSRLTIANNKIYQIVAIVSKANEASPTTLRYLSSFNIVSSAAGDAKK